MPATMETSVENDALKKALESLLFITNQPLSLDKLCKIVGIKDPPRLQALIAELRQELDEKGSAVQILEVADGFQMATRAQYAPFVKKLFTEKMTMRLSTAAHETLSIIAYKQPLTRAEIEQIRGVEVIAALETLLEKGLIKVVGRRETVGRPLMYGTTPDFLRHFGLRSLDDLPPLDQFKPSEETAPAVSSEPLVTSSATADETHAQSAAEPPSEISSAIADETPIPEQ